MTINGGSSSVQNPKAIEKLENKMQLGLGQLKQKDSFISEESANMLKDKMQNMSKCGKADKCVNLFEMLNKDPVAVVESVRNAEGSDRNQKLLNFQNKIDHMSEKELKIVRNHLVNEMSSPKNDDDQLLGALLNVVNKELDSRLNTNSIIDIIKPTLPQPIWSDRPPEKIIPLLNMKF